MTYFYLYAAISVLLIAVLAMNISRIRIQQQIGNGDGDNKQLKAAIRAHMNTIEHSVPFALLVLALCLLNWSQSGIAFVAQSFIILRVLHAWALLSRRFKLRQIAAALTYLLELGGALLVIFLALSA